MLTQEIATSVEKDVGALFPEEDLMMKKLRGILFLSALSMTAQADSATKKPPLETSGIVFRGSGCTDKNTTMSLDAQEDLHVKFAEFSATATNSKARERIFCTVRIPLTVPAGFRVGLRHAEVIGDAAVGDQGTGNVVFRYSRAGQSSKMVLQVLPSGFKGPFSLPARYNSTHNSGVPSATLPNANDPQSDPRNLHDIDWLDCDDSFDLIAQIDLIARQDARIQLHELLMPAPVYQPCNEQQEAPHVL